MLRHLSIRYKLVLLAGTASLVALLIAGAGFVANDLVVLRQTEIEHFDAQAEVLAAQASASFFNKKGTISGFLGFLVISA